MEGTEIGVGSDWCTLQVAKFCTGAAPKKVVFLGDKVRACYKCLRELYREEFSDEFDWTLRETWHEGKCEPVTVEFDSGEKVSACAKCLIWVQLRQDPEALDWVLIFHSKNHTGLKAGIWQGLSFPQAACRECLLIALYQVDPNFFRLLTKQGEDLIESIIPGALAWRRD